MMATSIVKWRRYLEYRPSGMEWLEEIPQHWETRRLKYMSSVNDDVLGENTDPDFEMLYVDISSVDSVSGIQNKELMRFENAPSRARRQVRNGDVIISTVRTYLRAIAPIDEPEPNLTVSTGFAVIRPKNGLNSPFAAYALLAPYFVDSVVARSVGVSYPAINASDLVNLRIALPPLSEQRTIAAFLDRETARIDALIAKKERQIELLQEKRTALISHVVSKGLNPDVKMKPSDIEWLGEIPEHWKIVPLKFSLLPRGDAIKTGPFGSQLLSSEMVTGSIKVYNQRNVLDRDFLSGENYVTEDKYQELIAFTIFPGDILVTTRGTIGRCALFPTNAQPGILHPCLMRIQANPYVVLPDYLSMLIQDGGIVLLQLKLMSNATTIDVIYSESLKSVRLPLPSTQEQQKILTWINREVTKHDTLIAKVCESIEKLREYRTALISSAVTGKIDVRNEAIR